MTMSEGSVQTHGIETRGNSNATKAAEGKSALLTGECRGKERQTPARNTWVD
jgi:hypothetical protein